VARTLAAVDVQDFARHEAGPFEIEDRVDDVGDFAQTAYRVQGGEWSVQRSRYLTLESIAPLSDNPCQSAILAA